MPRGHEVRRSLASKLSVGNAIDLIEPGKKITDFPGVTLYVARKEGNWLYDITATDPTDPDVTRPIHAEKALATGEGQDMALDLYMVKVDPVEAGKAGMASGRYVHYPVKVKEKRYIKKFKDLTWREIVAKLDEDGREVAQLKAAAGDGPEAKERYKSARKSYSKLRVEFSKRFVFALASLCFTLVGIPLGIRSQRKESTIGMAVSLAIALGFYLVAMLCLGMQKNYAMHPEYVVWLPVAACLALSVYFTRRNL